MAEEVLSLIFHSCLTSIEVRCLDRDDWAVDMVGSLNAALILKVSKTNLGPGLVMIGVLDIAATDGTISYDFVNCCSIMIISSQSD